MTRFILYSGAETLTEIELGGPRQPSLHIKETQRIGFVVEQPELSDDYRIFIGDRPLPDDVRPSERRRELDWESSNYLDGANGVTPITLRRTGDGFVLARVNALVEPSKLSEQAYRQMFSAITQVSVELLLDLGTKSRLEVSTSASPLGSGRLRAVSARVELNTIKRFWRSFSRVLATLLEAPNTTITLNMSLRRLRPGDRTNQKVLQRLAASGRKAKAAIRDGLTFQLPTLSITADTHENRVIVAFIRLLRRRVLRAGTAAETEMNAISNLIRSYAHTDANLQQFVAKRETPKLSKLLETISDIETLAAEMSAILRPLGVTDPSVRPPASADFETPTFRSHPTYARLAQGMRTFLSRTAIVIEQGDREGAKSLETLYEQWVFFEVCKALRAAGLKPVSHKSLFEPISRNRFFVDLDRNTSVVFEAADGLRASIRYEPTILPRHAAQGTDTVYRAGAKTPWTPDVLVEILVPVTGPLDYQLAYAVVIDAKYTKRHNLESRLNDVARYQEIRSVASDRQIVRQVWVAAPVESVISPRDEHIYWSQDGAVEADPSDVILGWVGVDPATPDDTEITMRSLVIGMMQLARAFAVT